MRGKAVFGIALTVLLIGTLVFAFNLYGGYVLAEGTMMRSPSSLALDSEGNPHISYYDDSNDDLKYAYYNGTWNTETVDTLGSVGRFNSLALDSTDNPHISYSDDSNDDLKYAYYNGVWNIETVDSTGYVGSYNSLALDSAGNPHISYYDDTNVDLKYAYYNGVWNIETVDSVGFGTIYIRADGSVDPSDAPISSVDNVTYVFTDDVYACLVVQKDYVVVDGAGHFLASNGGNIGIYLDGNTGVIIRNLRIGVMGIFETAIRLNLSSNITISGNEITRNQHSIRLWSSSNITVSGNKITDNSGSFGLLSSSNNTIRENEITDNAWGIWLDNSNYNSISGNNVTNNSVGIYLMESSNNLIYKNNFAGNTEQVYDASWDYPQYYSPSTNTWDNGYPAGGNYWNDYVGVDVKSGPHQDQPNGDGIGDAVRVIDADNEDRYPLMKPYGIPHDVGIRVSISKTVVAEGYNTTVTINMTTINYGEQTETFNLTFQINTPVQEQTLTLTSRNSTTMTSTWNTTGLPKGNYTFSANITTVPGETDTTDNTYIGWFLITIVGDVDGDRDVDVGDQRKVQLAMFSTPGDPNWNPNADINNDLDVDVGDQRKQQLHMFESW